MGRGGQKKKINQLIRAVQENNVELIELFSGPPRHFAGTLELVDIPRKHDSATNSALCRHFAGTLPKNKINCQIALNYLNYFLFLPPPPPALWPALWPKCRAPQENNSNNSMESLDLPRPSPVVLVSLCVWVLSRGAIGPYPTILPFPATPELMELCSCDSRINGIIFLRPPN